MCFLNGIFQNKLLLFSLFFGMNLEFLNSKNLFVFLKSFEIGRSYFLQNIGLYTKSRIDSEIVDIPLKGWWKCTPVNTDALSDKLSWKNFTSEKLSKNIKSHLNFTF